MAWSIGSCSLGQIERTVAAAMEAFDPEQAERDQQAALEGRRVNIHLGDLATAADPSTGAVVGFDGGLDVADALDLEAAVTARAAALKTLMPDASEDVRRSIALGDLARGKATMLPAPGDGAHDGAAPLDGTGAAEDATCGCTTGAGAPIGPAGMTDDDPAATDTTSPQTTGRTVMLYLHLRADSLNQHALNQHALDQHAFDEHSGAGVFGAGVVGRCENTRSPVTVEQVR
ncbi:hypothetical protein, partial [Ruania rhizosphaerae]|uniref:hypothetical protein n=1 Tax=Ruania rhizosphaerae TaxID=1840413 RepID=UPI001F38A341